VGQEPLNPNVRLLQGNFRTGIRQINLLIAAKPSFERIHSTSEDREVSPSCFSYFRLSSTRITEATVTAFIAVQHDTLNELDNTV